VPIIYLDAKTHARLRILIPIKLFEKEFFASDARPRTSKQTTTIGDGCVIYTTRLAENGNSASACSAATWNYSRAPRHKSTRIIT
jgi:hypothetical protein